MNICINQGASTEYSRSINMTGKMIAQSKAAYGRMKYRTFYGYSI